MTNTAALPAETERRLERFLLDWLADETVPGASVAIVADDELVYADGFGSRNLAGNAPATAETLYGMASVTKSFTGLAVGILDERGELSVDDPLTDHLPDVGIEALDADGEPVGDDDPITLHHLLTHSSGLPSLGSSTVLLYRLTGVEEFGVPLGDREDFRRHVAGAADEVSDRPGERFMYCNEGYNLLGEVVERVSGRSFETFVTEEVLDPLGMERSTFDPSVVNGAVPHTSGAGRRTGTDAGAGTSASSQPDSTGQVVGVQDPDLPDAMTPYALRDGEPEATPYPYRPVSLPAGGLIAPVTDLTRYLRMNANGGELDGTRIATPDTLARAHEGHVPDGDRHYGYGWSRREVEFLDRTLVGHGGSLGVSSSYVGFTTDGDYAVAIGANTTPGVTPPTVAQGVLAILEGEDPADVVPHYARKARFDELVGEYAGYRGIVEATVERGGGALTLTVEGALGNTELSLRPTEPAFPGYEFESPSSRGTPATVTFRPDGDHVDLFYERNRFHQVE
ncbi:serine hydrolase [Halorubrum gandharaense]